VKLVTVCSLVVGVALLVAGCGGGGSKAKTLGSEPAVIYSSADWQVVLAQHGSRPVAQVLHRVNDKAVVDRSHAVKLEILGPKPGEKSTANPPQVAIAMHSKTPLVESALWVDGNELVEKGGGTPTNGTIYGAPLKLSPGKHTAVGYARTADTGSAVAWTFSVR
jgi:hypothetical protein